MPLKDDLSGPCPLPAGVGPADNCPTAYLNRSTPYGSNSSAFHYRNHSTSTTLTKPFDWTPRRHAPPVAWPPLGLRLSVDFTAPATALPQHRDVVVSIHYELLQGAPVLSKSLSIRRGSGYSGIAASASVPVDQQGPVNIQQCDVVSPPSDWQLNWALPTPSGSTGPIRMGGPAGKCLTAVKGTAFHGWNDMLDARACNASDPAQRWMFNAATIVFKGDPCVGLGDNWCKCGDSGQACCVDVNNHQDDLGTTLQGDPCAFTEAFFVPVPSGAPGQVKLKMTGSNYADRCLTFTPLPMPPPPPPPPPPKPACITGSCSIVTHATIEVLRLNAEWGPDPSIPRPLVQNLDGARWGEFVDNMPSSAAAGLLEILPSQVHGSQVVSENDPTFVQAYAGNNGANEPMVSCSYAGNGSYGGPGFRLRAGGAPFVSFRCIETYSDSFDHERWGMGLRKRTRLLAPQSSETPQFVHLTNATPAGFRSMVDQMAVVGGFDMLIFSFGSEFNFEDTSPEYIAELKADVEYAKAHNIEVGGYDLISDTRGGTGYDEVSPATHAGTGSACMASKWQGILLDKVMHVLNATGMSMIETDGPYAGQPCAATDHDHYGVEDSVETQWKGQTAFYSRLRSAGAFVHAPDGYLYEGGANKECGGYQEMQENLPRWQSLSINRQIVHDETFTQTPTQAWQFAPLVDYHGGSNAALEPLSEHLRAWEWTLATYLGMGYGACYRGDRLFDTPAVQAMVTRWMSFWVRYRAILIQDVVHVRRPDMQQIDAIMHVDANATTSTCALMMVFNPAFGGGNATARIRIPLYYTGETEAVMLSQEEGVPRRTSLRRDFSVSVNVSLPPLGITYFVARREKTAERLPPARGSIA